MRYHYHTRDLRHAVGYGETSFHWANTHVAYPSRVLLTGCTGQLGRHLLRLLLNQEDIHQVVLPIRACSIKAAQERLHGVLGEWGLSAKKKRKIIVFPIRTLGEDLLINTPVDTIIHAAADVSLANTLMQAWEANVLSTQHLVRWAKRHLVSHMVHVSTLSVFVASDAPSQMLHENINLDVSQIVHGGYAASKWAAEAYVLGQTDVPISVHRCGLLVGGVPADHDPLRHIVQATAQHGLPAWFVPNSKDKFDAIDVDGVAHGIVKSLFHNPNIYHWAQRTSWSACDLHEALLSIAPPTQPQSWPLSMKKASRALGRYSDQRRHQYWWWHDLFQSSSHTYDTKNACDVHPIAPVNLLDLVKSYSYAN